MKAKKVVAGLLVSVMAVSVTACGHYPAEDEIATKMDEYVAGEHYSQTAYEEDDSARKVTVTYVSDERDLEFHLFADKTKSFWQVHFLDDGDVMSNHHFSTDYVHNIHLLYLEDIEDVLDEIYANRDLEWDQNTYRFVTGFTSPDDIPELVDVLVRANEIYAQELNYHSEEWLVDNCFAVVVINYRSEIVDGNRYAFIYLDGVSAADDYYEILNNAVEAVDGAN